MQVRIPVAAALAALIAVPIAIAAPGDVARVSLTGAATQLAQGADGPVPSADGSTALFTSTGAFSGAATAGYLQLFQRDSTTGQVSLVSSSGTGIPAGPGVDDDNTGATTPYGASYDGRYVVFSSQAANLVAGDANGTQRDVFRKDMLTGQVVIVSRDAAGAQPSAGVVGQPSLSADGSRVAFTSGDQPLVAADTNGTPDIYVADLRARTLTLVSRGADGRQSPTAVGHPAISANGRAVAFDGDAAAKVLASDDTDAQGDVYVAWTSTGAIGTASAGVGPAGDATLPTISGNGSRVAFLRGGNAWLRDLATRTTTQVSDAAAATGATGRPAISADGARVAYATTTAPSTVMAFTAATGARTAISQAASGGALGNPAARAAISGNGAVGAFSFDDAGTTHLAATIPVAGDTNNVRDAFATRLGDADTTPPAIAARAAATGGKVVVSGRATDAAGVIAVTMGGRRAVLGDDGTFAVTLTPAVGTGVVAVVATNGIGLQSSADVATERAWAAARLQTIPVRPTGLRATELGGTVRVRFRIALRATVRAEVRWRVPGTVHAQAYRLVVGRTLRNRQGAVGMSLRLPRTTLRGGRPYQVRVLASTARGLGTAATTITLT